MPGTAGAGTQLIADPSASNSDPNLQLQQQRSAAAPVGGANAAPIPQPPSAASAAPTPNGATPMSSATSDGSIGAQGANVTPILPPPADAGPPPPASIAPPMPPPATPDAPPPMVIPPPGGGPLMPATPPAPPATTTPTTPTTPTTTGRDLSAVGPTDTGTPSIPTTPLTLSTATPLTPSSGGPYTASDVSLGSTVLPNADPRLQNLQGLVDQAATSLNSVDPTQLATQEFNTFASETNPAYEEALKEANATAFANGQGGSGQLRTSIGNLANERNEQLENEDQALQENALSTSMANQYNKLNALSGLEGQQFGEQTTNNNQLDQQQGFQNTLDQEALNQALEQYELGQQSTQQQFNNGVTLTQLGNASNPANYYALLASEIGANPSTLTQLGNALGQSSMGSGTSPLAGLSLPIEPGYTPTPAQQAQLNSLLSVPLPPLSVTPSAPQVPALPVP